ncbi:hypothetical protein DOT_2754 [Desulfosporosinus sp. OT]|nr:hypothetical protein DOT_2754 [Desulfosporosinus sp. OT]
MTNCGMKGKEEYQLTAQVICMKNAVYNNFLDSTGLPMLPYFT